MRKLTSSTFSGEMAMAKNFRSSNRWTDEQLEAIMSETGEWAVNGRQGQVLCLAASFRRAMDRAAEYAAAGAVVTAISRLSPGNIIVFDEQIARLRKTIAVREVVPDDRGANRSA
jgi:hypothetical protein